MTGFHTIAEAFLMARKSLNPSMFTDITKVANMLFEDLLEVTNTLRTDQLSLANWQVIETAVDRLNTGEPFQYVTQVAHFYGMKFYVDRRVLIPRPETEELVYYLLIKLTADDRKSIKILDIGTGSGCIALSLKNKNPLLDVTAIDVSADALDVAEINRANYQLDVSFVLDDIVHPHSLTTISGEWDYIVSNPPYIQKEECDYMDDQVLAFEPLLALFPENVDALGMYKAILKYSYSHLKRNGWFFLELNEFLSEQIKKIAINLGFVDISIIIDMQGKARILVGRKTD